MKRPVVFVLALAGLSVLHLGCSKGSSSPVAPVDSTPPGTIADLAAATSDGSSVTINWTAPGGDGASGTAITYEIRYGNTDVVSPTDWSQWTVIANPPTPQAAGAPESFKVTPLATASEFVLALRSKDAAGNWSGQSNAVVGRTTGYRRGPVLVVALQNYPYATYSENGGRTWKNGILNGSNARLGWIERDPISANTLYGLPATLTQNLGGSGASRIWKSSDHGKTWSILTAGGSFLNGGGCSSLAVSPTTSGLMYVNVEGVCLDGYNNCCGNCAGDVYRSTDGGVSWQSISTYNRYSQYAGWTSYQVPFNSLAVDPTDGQHLFAAGSTWTFSLPGGGSLSYGPLLITYDGGQSWTGLVNGLPYSGLNGVAIHTIDIHPADPTKLLISTTTGILRSTDGGGSWINVSAITSGRLDFVHDPGDPDHVYTPMVQSTNGGLTWTPLTTPSGGQEAIGIDPSRNEIYAAGSGGLYRSTDSGATWTQVLNLSDCTSVAVLPDLVVALPAEPRLSSAWDR